MILRVKQDLERIKYFEARFVNALRGQTILYINRDIQGQDSV
jgi:hypothetical protein